ncbi:DNA-3-methyladenine glycosylase [Candidatus Burkholderia pumila]|uniref:DNA-3-methyladenine glycosylase n=1 Tax=Candidatus Burkholderia pumila TaxID=1090375 RepID=A0ABR5HP13_9BURK|nr:DNA-3-methyladenine glycosylase [Candidatus Burkholderia pumila]
MFEGRVLRRRISSGLVSDARIVRNRQKIEAAVLNARAVKIIQQEHGSFADFVWSFVGNKPIDTPRDEHNPTPESDALLKALKTYNCKFVGTTICYASMQATGMVNGHAATCSSRTKSKTKRKIVSKTTI